MPLLDLNRRYFKFDWDEAKRAANLTKHGIDFADAPKVWGSQMFTAADARQDYGEARYLSLGRLGERVVVVVHVERADVVRIVSMRYAKSHEQEAYFAQVARLGRSG